MSTDVSVLDERYALEDLLGRGGMADVYRATDLVLGRTVAIKVLRAPTSEGTERARFTDEARTLAGLSHPNLTAVLDAGISGSEPYLVLELVEGQSLAACCADVALEPGRVRTIGTQLADALDYAHSAGVVHRDVKPANVIITPTDRAVLTDFGIAKLVSQAGGHTRTGTTIGSPAYLAPEQVRGERPGTAVDIYSLGLVLLEALTGTRAYPGAPTEAALARLTTPPQVPDALPARWRELLVRMTDLDPARRPSAAAVRDALDDDQDPGPDATRVLTQPVVPAVGPPRTTSAAHDETHVLAGPSRVRERVDAARAWVSARQPQASILALLLVAGVVMFAVAAFGSSNGGNDARTEVPAGVPNRLQEPLADLHAAVEGGR